MRHGVKSLRESWCRAECAPGRTRAAEGNGRRPIVCTRNRTDPISGCTKNGDVPVFHRSGPVHSGITKHSLFFISRMSGDCMGSRPDGHQSRNGAFFIADPSWIGENGEEERITGVEGILVDVKDVKWVEFLENTWENREWLKRLRILHHRDHLQVVGVLDSILLHQKMSGQRHHHRLKRKTADEANWYPRKKTGNGLHAFPS